MVNKQVLGRGAREGLGQRTNARLPQTRFLGGSVQERGRTGGDTVFRGLSGATLPTKSIYTRSPRRGQEHRAARREPRGCGAASP